MQRVQERAAAGDGSIHGRNARGAERGRDRAVTWREKSIFELHMLKANIRPCPVRVRAHVCVFTLECTAIPALVEFRDSELSVTAVRTPVHSIQLHISGYRARAVDMGYFLAAHFLVAHFPLAYKVR